MSSQDYYQLSAKYYDATYSFKDYSAETARLLELIAERRASKGNELLEVACGTGLYLEHLKKHFQVTGLDISSSMLAMAREKFPEIIFHQDDMRSFHLDKEYDVIVCLFSSIAYLLELDDWAKTLNNFYTHLKPGGVAVVETFIRKEIYKEGLYSALNLDLPDCKLSRHNTSVLNDKLVSMDMHTLVSSSDGVVHFREEHIMRVHDDEDLARVAQKSDLSIEIRKNGLLEGRDLIILKKPLN